jgi:hypothetical protein
MMKRFLAILTALLTGGVVLGFMAAENVFVGGQ